MTGCAVIFIILFTLLNAYVALVEVYPKTLPSGHWICVYPDTPITDLRQFLIGQIPLVILIPSNIIIIIKLYYQRKKWKNLNNQQRKEEKKSLQLTVMILSLTITFIILTLPFSIYIMVFHDPDKAKEQAKQRNILSTFTYTNAAVNFYLYFLSSEMYRKAVKKQLLSFFKIFGIFRGRIEPTSQASSSQQVSDSQHSRSKNVT